MKRTIFNTKEKEEGEVQYNSLEEPIIISIPLFDLLKKQKNFDDLYVLYSFYYYTAKWQKTNQPKAVTSFVANGVGWGIDKVIERKKELKKLGLITEVQITNEKGRMAGSYIHVNFVWSKDAIDTLKTPPTGVSSDGKTPPTGKSRARQNPVPNALSTGKLNALSTSIFCPADELLIKQNGYITPSKFPEFWNLYPRKEKRGDAEKAWNDLCNKKDNPTWRVIKNAIIDHKQSEQWKDPKLIALPATWLNKRKYKNKGEDMKLFNFEKSTAKITTGSHASGIKTTYTKKSIINKY